VAADTAPLAFREKLGYGLGDTASNFFFQVFNIFLLYYYTDVYGLAPAAVGTMFLVTKIIDAVSDPVMGLVADRTESRWGKFRPYLLWAAVPYGLCGYAMFASPDLSDTGKLIYAYVTYSLMMLIYTAINVPYSALMGVISPVSIERTKVASYRFFCAFSAAWLIATFVTPLNNMLGGGNDVVGFRLTMAIFAIISVSLFWTCFATTRERVRPEPSQSNIRSDLRTLLQNGPWVALFFAGIFTLMTAAMRNGAAIFYFKYYVGDDGTALFLIFDKTAIFLSAGTFAMVAGVMATQYMCRLFDKRQLMIFLTLGNAAIMSVFYFISPDYFWTMVVVGAMGNLLVGPSAAIVWAMYADTADYGEWKTGRRTTALVFSGVQFSHKLGLAVGAGASGYILYLFGFVANQPQGDTAMSGIRLMFSVFPAVLAVLSAVAIYFYPLSGARVKLVERELALRR